jgi:hypothetical protein
VNRFLIIAGSMVVKDDMAWGVFMVSVLSGDKPSVITGIAVGLASRHQGVMVRVSCPAINRGGTAALVGLLKVLEVCLTLIAEYWS